MRKQLPLVALSFVLALALACAANNRIMYQPRPITVPKSIDGKKTARLIRKTLVERGWMIEKEGPTETIAKVSRQDHMAKVRISYASHQIKISYLDSKNLSYEKVGEQEKIHGRYNSWVQNLEKDLNNAVATAHD